jgi:hypothetical protein
MEPTMGFNITWDNQEKTIVKAEISAPFTWDELFAAWDTVVGMVSSMPHPVHIVVLSQAPGFPPGNVLAQLNRISISVPDNTGLAIMVTTNRFIAVINSTLFKLSPKMSKRGRVVSSLDDAYALIAAETSVKAPIL